MRSARRPPSTTRYEAYDAAGNVSRLQPSRTDHDAGALQQPARELERREHRHHLELRRRSPGRPTSRRARRSCTGRRPLQPEHDAFDRAGHEPFADDHRAHAEHDVSLRGPVDGQREQHRDLARQPVHDVAQQHHVARHADQGADDAISIGTNRATATASSSSPTSRGTPEPGRSRSTRPTTPRRAPPRSCRRSTRAPARAYGRSTTACRSPPRGLESALRLPVPADEVHA